MPNWARQIRANWNRTDSIVQISNTIAFGLFIANTRWGSVWVCTMASLVPLAIQLARARVANDALRPALLFGVCMGGAWPIGEGIVTRTFGWWGEYLAPGPVVWRTPVYCMLIGWLASTHIYYFTRRMIEIGWRPAGVMLHAAIMASIIGVIGENLFVSAHMWAYFPSSLDWMSVPAFVPVAYGIGYSVLPLLHGRRAVYAFAAVAATLLVVSVGLGIAVGFFPRHIAGQ